MSNIKNIMIDIMNNEMLIKTTVTINIGTTLDDSIYKRQELLIELYELVAKYKDILSATQIDEYSDGNSSHKII